MSFTLRGRTVAFDNLVPGSAAGRERTILGQTPSTELVGGGTGSSTDAAGASALSRSTVVSGSAYPTANIPDNYIIGTATPAAEDKVSTS